MPRIHHFPTNFCSSDSTSQSATAWLYSVTSVKNRLVKSFLITTSTSKRDTSFHVVRCTPNSIFKQKILDMLRIKQIIAFLWGIAFNLGLLFILLYRFAIVILFTVSRGTGYYVASALVFPIRIVTETFFNLKSRKFHVVGCC